MCFREINFNKKSKLDLAFMGSTHALSAVAATLALVAFVPGFTEFAGLTSLALVILATLVVTGGALIPDLDNSQSSAKSALGFFGSALSVFFITSSKFIQTIFRTSRDDTDQDPHRGFWHTIPAALLIGFLTFLVTQIHGTISIPVYDEVSFSWVIALIITVVCVHLALVGLSFSAVKKLRKKSVIGEIIAFVVSFGITAVLFWFVPHNNNFWWLSVAITLGVIVHIVGDAFTTAGVPILFPVSVFLRGKFWWKTRFTPMKAGGVGEKFVMTPIFIVIIAISLYVLIF